MAIGDSEAAMADFMSEGGWVFPVMLKAERAAGAYGVVPIPTLFVVDGEGIIVKKIVGKASAEDLSGLVDGLTD